MAADLEASGFKVSAEVAIDDAAPLLTTLIGRKTGVYVLVECQNNPTVTPNLESLAGWLALNRVSAELYVATRLTASVSGAFMQRLESHGIGLIFVADDETIAIQTRGTNHALVTNPAPGLPLGKLRAPVAECFRRFNRGERKPALQEIAEIVERETLNLLIKASRKGILNKTEAEIEAMSWSSQIDVAASKGNVAGPGAPLFDPAMKHDMHSFRGGRNLVDHKVRNKWGETKREKQFAERMMMGSRLAAELVTRRRAIK